MANDTILGSIVDVPDDLGGRVRIYYSRSGRDYAGGASLPIADYGIWQRVASGVYFCRLTAKTFEEKRKMLLIK